eukprot:CAMPEP_0176389970 /NCGR_PEP_ID=MMETSP0126-20121128/38802_1 /TAXON_ID=141414 ORGANISM="Strombidinopsis acuminatum, Strain SPMC142" /NCGR_SAMPLE_ID=MMETSP0126 /ASSEMBLY_ACC=CAM_ASM_000229 /LENGTH=135 /DNA_ID=CAMNT_0017759103 /DNA_START=651 /DNA_END=1058 /DNA_ORIENTATION=+
MLNVIAAIDFTYSNGHPATDTSHHYIKSGYVNNYQKALLTILKSIEKYDSDRKIAAFGFGGVPLYMEETDVSYCFPLNGNKEDFHCKNDIELLECYKKNVPKIEMSGPTKFAPLLKKVNEYVTKDKKEREEKGEN